MGDSILFGEKKLSEKDSVQEMAQQSAQGEESTLQGNYSLLNHIQATIRVFRNTRIGNPKPEILRGGESLRLAYNSRKPQASRRYRYRRESVYVKLRRRDEPTSSPQLLEPLRPLDLCVQPNLSGST